MGGERERDESLRDLAGFEQSRTKRETLRQKTQVSLGEVALRGLIVPEIAVRRTRHFQEQTSLGLN